MAEFHDGLYLKNKPRNVQKINVDKIYACTSIFCMETNTVTSPFGWLNIFFLIRKKARLIFGLCNVYRMSFGYKASTIIENYKTRCE